MPSAGVARRTGAETDAGLVSRGAEGRVMGGKPPGRSHWSGQCRRGSRASDPPVLVSCPSPARSKRPWLGSDGAHSECVRLPAADLEGTEDDAARTTVPRGAGACSLNLFQPTCRRDPFRPPTDSVGFFLRADSKQQNVVLSWPMPVPDLWQEFFRPART